MLGLEKYHGTASRHTCPNCGKPRVFVRYVDDAGNYLADDVGRCNRESKCGYHRKPKEWFADNPQTSNGQFKKAKKRGKLNYAFTIQNDSQVECEAKVLTEKPDYIPFEDFKATLGNYEQNGFVQFLLNLFPETVEDVQAAIENYYIGTFDDYTCFHYIDRQKRICRAKLIRFNQNTGKRLKGEFDTHSLVKKLKLKEDFNYRQVFFGEHLLPKNLNKAVAIVEAEKTAIIASIYFPQFVWLGSNSKTWLKVERLQRLDNRQIILFPDADGFNQWKQIAAESQRQGLNVKVSDLIETQATAEQKAEGYDLADYLITERHELNESANTVKEMEKAYAALSFDARYFFG